MTMAAMKHQMGKKNFPQNPSSSNMPYLFLFQGREAYSRRSKGTTGATRIVLFMHVESNPELLKMRVKLGVAMIAPLVGAVTLVRPVRVLPTLGSAVKGLRSFLFAFAPACVDGVPG
jgi:hypothetical protein